MPELDVTPGGVALPAGYRIVDVLPRPDGRGAVPRRHRGGVPTAPRVGRHVADGPLVTYQTIYDTQPMVGTVVNKIVRNLARLPWLVERPDDRGRMVPVRDPRHPLVRLLERPAPGLGGMALKQWLSFGLLVDGNALLLKHHADLDGPPTELFPLAWKYLQAFRRPGGFVDRWVTTEGGGAQDLDRGDVVHLAWWSDGGASGQVGISPLEQLGATIRLDEAAQRFVYSNLAGGAHPGGGFKLPPDVQLTDELAAALRGVLDAWSGVDAAGGVPILAGGASWETFQQSAKDAALVETRHRDLEEVCMVYDTSPTVIGVLRDATQRGNVAELNRDFYGNTLGPPRALIAEAINVQLVDVYEPWREEGLRVRLDASEFLRGDPVEWERVQNEKVLAGRQTLNEAREQDGQLPYTDPKANEPLVQANNLLQLSRLGEVD